jgi:hypothetical protein
MTRGNSPVNKTLEDPEQQHHPEKPRGTIRHRSFLGTSGRNTIARDHPTAIPRLGRMAVFLCRIGAEGSGMRNRLACPRVCVKIMT